MAELRERAVNDNPLSRNFRNSNQWLSVAGCKRHFKLVRFSHVTDRDSFEKEVHSRQKRMIRNFVLPSEFFDVVRGEPVVSDISNLVSDIIAFDRDAVLTYSYPPPKTTLT